MTLLTLMSLSIPSLLAAPIPTTIPRYAEVLSIEGTVWKVDAAPAGIKSALKSGDHLQAGTRFQTSTASSITLKLGRDVTTLVKASTVGTLELKEEVDWSVSLEKGSILSAVKNPAKRPQHFSIRTKTAVMGVRGTAFFVRQELGKAPYVCTCHGTIEFRDADDRLIQEVKTTHHDFPVKVGQTLKKVPMDSEHSDADIQTLERWLGTAAI